MIDLNTPHTRQDELRRRLVEGAPLVAASLSAELGVSVDTIRRDLISLEQQGFVKRTRGGAVPVTAPMPPYLNRVEDPDPVIGTLAACSVKLISDTATVFLDGGTTMNAIAARLPEDFKGLVVTPAPSVALAALGRGARVHLIGGSLCPEGAMSTGGAAERMASEIAADLSVLGACGLWPDFGLAAEDGGEAGIKRAMALASSHVLVVTSATKLGWKGRHRVLALDEIDHLVTDATPEACRRLVAEGIVVTHV